MRSRFFLILFVALFSCALPALGQNMRVQSLNATTGLTTPRSTNTGRMVLLGDTNFPGGAEFWDTNRTLRVAVYAPSVMASNYNIIWPSNTPSGANTNLCAIIGSGGTNIHLLWGPGGGGAGATAINDLGDATGTGSVALGVNPQTWTTVRDAADSPVMLLSHTTGSTTANDQVIFGIDFADTDPANKTFLRFRYDVPGAPIESYLFKADAGTISPPMTLSGGATVNSFLRVPNGAAVVTDAFGEIAADNNAWATGRGALQFFDGTTNTFVVAVVTNDVPSNGQIPKFNSATGTFTFEDDNAAADSATKMNSTNGQAYGDFQILNRFTRTPAKVLSTVVIDVLSTNSWTLATATNTTVTLSGAATNGQTISLAASNYAASSVNLTSSPAVFFPALASNVTVIPLAVGVTFIDFFYTTNFTAAGQWYITRFEGPLSELVGGVNSALVTNGNTISVTASTTITTNGTLLGTGITNVSWIAGVTGALSGATANLGVVPLGVYRTIYVPAGSLITNLTGGALLKTEETGSNKKMRDYLEFDGTVTNSATVGFRMPQEWNLGTVKVKFDWSSTNAAATQTNVWAIAAGAVSDDDPVDGAFGTEVTVDDVVTAANDQLLSAATAAVTVGGTPVAEDFVDWRVRRLPGHAQDNMSGVAKLYGIWIQYLERSNATTSW